jgi:hypothetical protein
LQNTGIKIHAVIANKAPPELYFEDKIADMQLQVKQQPGENQDVAAVMCVAECRRSRIMLDLSFNSQEAKWETRSASSRC